MPEPATKEDLAELAKLFDQTFERLIEAMRSGFARVDRRFDELNARFEVQEACLKLARMNK
jgi:hypothetical protein